MHRESREPRAATVRDVADHAGVSIATVSRALSGSRPMSEELRDRVLSSAAVLGYQVNLVARALRKEKTSSFGLVIPDLENPFFSSLAQQVSRGFSESEVDVMIASADNDISQELRAVRSFLGRQVDGLIVIPSDETRSLEALEIASQHVPTVQFDRFVPGTSIPFIGVDNHFGMQLVHDHIAQQVPMSHQQVFFVGGGSSSSSGRERTAGFLALHPETNFRDGSFSFAWGQEAARGILSEGNLRGTIVCAADVIALGVISRLAADGLKVPHDFRLIGFDDVGVSHLVHPALTTVRQPIFEMTAVIQEMLYNPDSKMGTQFRLMFRPDLIVRQSSPHSH